MADDEDEEGGAPTKYEFSTESKLDEDHLFYLQFTNNFISNVTRPRDFDHCSRWLEKLAGEPMYGVEAKRNRNMYLAKLLIAMQDNRVVGPFSSFPPAGPLLNAGDAFGLTTEEEKGESGDLMFNQHDRELNMADYKYKSEDGRTYVATCALPQSSGVMGYVGITYGGGEGLWLNKDGEKVSLTDVMCGDRITTVIPDTPVKEHIKLYESFDWKQPADPPEDPFNFVLELPSTQSNTALIVGNHSMSAEALKNMRDSYPEELVQVIERLMEKSKEAIDELCRHRYNKIVPQMYASYQEEVERGLNDYKAARKEWQLVMSVIQNMKQVEKELGSKDSNVAAASNDMNKLLTDTYDDANVRKKDAFSKGQQLDASKADLHKNIHERLIIHKNELGVLNGHIENLCLELKKMRVDARRKQLVLEGLMHDRKRRENDK